MTTTELFPVPGGSHIWAERAGDGPPLVLLHGSVHDSRLWNGVFAALARHHTVVRYDARGHGRSTPATAPFRYEGDLLAVLDRFGFRSAELVGLSMGGEVALDFTLEIGAPTMIVVGDHDHPEIGVIAGRLAAGIPGARLEVVADSDHCLPLRAPGRLLELLVGCSDGSFPDRRGEGSAG
ncbi:alpha/beta fold hydrolase [Streptomyces sp. NPDC058049]|uniref:alpha/beta fold hydrolase n=1 Tax=Streptomyces sp. NPDC058049 TaxID=3346314 RepID=UPI0036E0CF63